MKKERSIKQERVQTVNIRRGLIQRLFGLAGLQVETAGGKAESELSLAAITLEEAYNIKRSLEVAGGGSSDQNHITLLFPLLRTAELDQFFKRILPEYLMPASFTPLPSRAMRRYIFRAAAPMLLLIVPLQWVPYGWLSFFLLIPAVFWGYSRYLAGGTALDDRQLALRFRFINRFRVLVFRNCVQAQQVSVNPFQRWRDLRSVTVWVLSSPSGKAFQVTDVEGKEARRIWDWYSRS